MIFIKIIRISYKIFLFCFLSILVIILGFYTNAYLSPAIDIKTKGNYYIYDNNDELVNDLNNEQNWIKLENISDNIINAVISVEDKNFYNHNGFDYIRILKALFNNFKNQKIVEGASTISQQYIKNAYLSFDQTWSRKIKEAILTLNLETHYSKDEILEAYLNTINYGNGNYGIKNASLYYFNKDVKDLSIEEALILAGIPKSPSNYNPVSDYSASIKRAKTVAYTMVKNNYLSNNDYNSLDFNNIEIYGKKSEDNLQMIMYYKDVILNELNDLNIINEEDIDSSGLKIYTSLNIDLQKTLENEIKNNLEDENMQIASVLVNPNNGEIMALTGGIDYSKSEYNRALYSKRQVGSTMKPFLYYAALNKGMTSSSKFLSQYTTFNLGNGKTYSPKNYANIYPNKEITMAAAIAYSDNVYAVKTNLFLGVNELINTAKLCGIKEDFNEVVSLALGTKEINIIDFATGYTTFASGGYAKNLHVITKVEDKDGNELYNFKDTKKLVLNPNYTYILNELLTTTTNSAFLDYNTPTALSLASKLSRKYAIKTGTTDTDYWTVGYNKDLLMIIWSGYDDSKDIGKNAGIIDKTIFANVVESYTYKNENSWYNMPENVIGIPLDGITGDPTSDSSKVNMFYYLKGSEPILN